MKTQSNCPHPCEQANSDRLLTRVTFRIRNTEFSCFVKKKKKFFLDYQRKSLFQDTWLGKHVCVSMRLTGCGCHHWQASKATQEETFNLPNKTSVLSENFGHQRNFLILHAVTIQTGDTFPYQLHIYTMNGLNPSPAKLLFFFPLSSLFCPNSSRCFSQGNKGEAVAESWVSNLLQ